MSEAMITANKKRWRQLTNVPPLQIILMAMWMHWSNAHGIAWCSTTRATQEAFGCRHQATTSFVLPWRPPGQQSTKQRWQNTPTLLAILMAIAMQQYDTTCITWWMKSVALREATGHHHQASICLNKNNWTCWGCFLSYVNRHVAEIGCKVKGWSTLTIGVWN